MVAAARARKRRGDSLTRDVKRGETRTNFTHVAFICDDAETQVLLPRVILVSERTMSAQTASAIMQSLPPPCIFLRCKSAWVTETTMLLIAAELRKRLAPFCTTHAFTLFADSYKAHIGKRALRAYARAGLRFCCIPAGLTWALQPCDTHVFAVYKRRLRELCEDVALRREDGKVGPSDVVNAVLTVIATLLNGRSWTRAFADLGLSGTQLSLSQRVREKLHFPGPLPLIPPGPPDLPQLMHIFPRGLNIPIAELFTFYTQGAHETAVHMPEAHAAPLRRTLLAHGRVSEQQPWFGRTRSTCAQGSDLPTGAASSTEWPRPQSVLVTAETRHPQIPFLPNARRLPWPPVTSTPALLLPPTTTLPLPAPPAETSSPQFNA